MSADDRPRYYLLDADGEPRAVEAEVWSSGFETADRVVLQTAIDRRTCTAREAPLERRRPGARAVSTVFLGMDHNFHGGGAPVLWETMIFGGLLDGWQRRHRSRLEALCGHAAAVATVRALGRRLPRKTKHAWRKDQGQIGRLSRIGPRERRRIVRLEYRLTYAEIRGYLAAE